MAHMDGCLGNVYRANVIKQNFICINKFMYIGMCVY